MTITATTRLLLAATMFILLLLSLAYWWLGNLPHELFGSLLFGLMTWHIITNRRWFTNLSKGRYDAQRVAIVLLHAALIVGIVVVLLTSLIISKSLFVFLPFPDSVPLRDVHWFSAYWVMVIVGLHFGIHWQRVMSMTRLLLGIQRDSAIRSWLMRGAVFVVVAFGFWSVPVLDVWTKLTFNFSLNFWNFERSLSPFFIHWAAVVAIPAALAHYTLLLMKRVRRPTGSLSLKSSEAR